MRLHTLRELDQTEGTLQLRKVSGDPNNAESSLVLFPRPSENDPNDPLRWPTWKKHVTFGSVCAFTFLTNYGIGGLAPAFYILSLEFGKTMHETSNLLLWPIFVLGLFNFFWVPMANYFGKRPIFVFASLVLCVCYIWGATAKTFDSLLWSNIVAAAAGSSTEALGAAIVNDLYFVHERGSKMGVYMNSISGGNTIGPLICGFVVHSLGWRWHKWMAVIFTGINFLLVLFFVPETRYDRSSSLNLSANSSSQAMPSSSENISDAEKATEPRTREPLGSPPTELTPIPKKTFTQELSLWSGVPANTNILKMFVRPLPMIVYPSVAFAFLGYAVSLAWVVAVNILNPFVLEAPPYNWRPDINGLINIPGLIGNIIGAYAGGWLVDKFCNWRTKRNNGVFEPESRLYLLIFPLVIVPAGCILFGYGVQRTMHWTTMFFGYGMISVGLTAVPTITLAYVSDCLLLVNPDALLLANGLKNIVAFGFLYGVIPWVEDVGYIECFGTQAGLYVAIIGIFGVLLTVYGAKLRHITSQWRIIL